MAREQDGEPPVEASLLNRRELLRATGFLAGAFGLSTASTRATARSTDVSVEMTSVTANHSWQNVQLSGSYANPVAIAGPVSYRGPQPASPRLRNVTESGFDLTIEEWLYLDGSHRFETVGCLVTEEGSYGLGDGTELVAGRTRANHRWVSTSFADSFSTTPVVFSQAQTVNGAQPVVTRHRRVSESGFDVRLQEEEAQGAHLVEDVGYLAITPGTGTLNGRAFEADVQTGVDSTWHTVTFHNAYRQPVFLADLQTFRGANTCTVRYRNLSESSVDVKVEEERSSDREVAHLSERVGYLVCEGAAETPAAGYGRDGYGRGGFGQ